MKIAVPAESAEGETRVSLVPETVGRLTGDGHTVAVMAGAGGAASFSDHDYRGAGAEIVDDLDALLSDAGIVTMVGEPTTDELDRMASGVVLIGMLRARQNDALIDDLAARGITAFSMEMVPRIARAQRLDVLSSQASLAGYKAVLMASNTIGRFFPLMMTAAGTIPPATVLILGAGVAGLQAIATARRLGARVQAFDVRSAVREQVESLGADFVEIEVRDAEAEGGYAKEQSGDEQERQNEALAAYVAKADVVITTAQIPGRTAPMLVRRATVAAMRPGSVIIDLAAESGGNCEGTVAGEETVVDGVTIVGPVNVPARMPEEASLLYSRNLQGLLDLILGEDGLTLDFEDEVVAGTVVTHAAARAGQLTPEGGGDAT